MGCHASTGGDSSCPKRGSHLAAVSPAWRTYQNSNLFHWMWPTQGTNHCLIGDLWNQPCTAGQPTFGGQRHLLLRRRRWFFFFLHCRTSARHGRSTTGISMWLRSNFPGRKKPTTNPPKTSNTHTQAKARARQICQGNLQTKWNKVKHTRPSQPLKCSRPPCSTPPRSPIVRCQPYQYLHLDTQASLLRLASDVVAWVDTCPL